MYRLTVDGIQSYFVVSRNVFSSHLKVHKKYDLKGSTVDREANEKELEKQLPTLKDNDFIKNQVKINIGDSAKEKLTETLNADVDVSESGTGSGEQGRLIDIPPLQFLTKLHLMDYSLLVGIHDRAKAEEDAATEMTRSGGDQGIVRGETSDSEECDSGDR